MPILSVQNIDTLLKQRVVKRKCNTKELIEISSKWRWNTMLLVLEHRMWHISKIIWVGVEALILLPFWPVTSKRVVWRLRLHRGSLATTGRITFLELMVTLDLFRTSVPSVCWHLSVVEGIECSVDPKGYVSGNISSWQGHPSWTGRRGRTRPRSAPSFGWDVKPRSRVLRCPPSVHVKNPNLSPRGSVWSKFPAPGSPISFPHLFSFLFRKWPVAVNRK